MACPPMCKLESVHCSCQLWGSSPYLEQVHKAEAERVDKGDEPGSACSCQKGPSMAERQLRDVLDRVLPCQVQAIPACTRQPGGLAGFTVA